MNYISNHVKRLGIIIAIFALMFVVSMSSQAAETQIHQTGQKIYVGNESCMVLTYQDSIKRAHPNPTGILQTSKDFNWKQGSATEIAECKK